MERNFEMFDVTRRAEVLPHFYVDARTQPLFIFFANNFQTD
jgi:hypothetical protein